MIWTALAEFAPNLFVRIFMTPTEEILAIAPNIIRSYGISFLLLPFNIFSTYYFQALMKPTASFLVSVGRGAVISGILIYLLPAVLGANAVCNACHGVDCCDRCFGCNDSIFQEVISEYTRSTAIICCTIMELSH